MRSGAINIDRLELGDSRARRRRRRALRNTYLELPVLELRHRQQAALVRLLNEARELRHAEVFLVEARIDILHDLLESIGAHDVAVPLHARHRFADELPRIEFASGLLLARFHETGEGVVAVVLVAILNEQIARRLANTDADNVLAVFFELDDKAREIRIAREKNEGSDLRASEYELEGVDGEANVGRVFL